MIDQTFEKTLEVAQKYFASSKRYGFTVNEAVELIDCGFEVTAGIKLSNLPSDKDLYEELLDTLKGKPVYKTIKTLGEAQGYEALKAFSSLMTHALIECEHGNTEYRMVVDQLYEAIGRLLHQ